jgi:hypothetical protein
MLPLADNSPIEDIKMALQQGQQKDLFQPSPPVTSEIPATLRASAVELIKHLLAEALVSPTQQSRPAESTSANASESGNDQDHS